MNKLVKILILLIVLGIGVSQTDIVKNIIANISTASATGGLEIDWGVPDGEPIFVINNMLPGDNITRTIKITNDSDHPIALHTKATKTAQTGNLADKLDITITQNGNPVYGPKSLTNFFSDNFVNLGQINSDQELLFTFTVIFDLTADNQYMNKTVVFDLQIGAKDFDIPEACGHGRFDRIIYGSDHNDYLRGANGKNLIFGFGGNDTISGGNSNDCLLGGEGNDQLNGGNGKDALMGMAGKDRLSGGNGNDFLDGGNDIDSADGGLGTDTCIAENLKKCEH